MATHPERALSNDGFYTPAGETFGSATDRVLRRTLARGFGWPWLAGIGISLAFMQMGLISAAWLLLNGVGVWGVQIPVAWGLAIVNFVWWIGIGHAGTLISAILLLLRQSWRTSINRFAEAMTLFAVANAGLFPLMHLGRFWKFYYLLPYPNSMGLWPQWRSPLVWDVFAVFTYSLVSLLFWYQGLIPDLATLRDATPRKWVRRIAGFFALGWRGAARHWHRFQLTYLLLAGLATPLVVSVHSIVSLDFSVGIVPGWHSTIFPPYFVAGAIYSGFAMVLTIAIPLRVAHKVRDLVTIRHLDLMAKVMLTSGLIVAYGYVMETFTGWYSEENIEHALIHQRAFGDYAPVVWTTLFCNVAVLQTLWFRWVRTHPIPLFIASLLINLGMWLERFAIVEIGLHKDYIPSAWQFYLPTFWDWTLLLGSLGFFSTLMFLFIRFIPIISMSEVREQLHEEHGAEACDRNQPDEEAGAAEQEMLPGVEPDAAVHGVMAEFDDPEALLDAARQTRIAGYRRLDAYTPYPVEGIREALGFRRSRIAWIVLLGGIVGGASAYFMQWYSAVISYPINVGGRPNHSWPSFIPITFELAVLGGATFGLIGMLLRNGFPRPYHPVMAAPGFERASRDRFFLCVEREDPMFDRESLIRQLGATKAIRVTEVIGPERSKRRVAEPVPVA